MIRFLLRFVGLLSLALAFIFVVYDGTKWIADRQYYVTRVIEVWAMLHEGSLAQLQPLLEGVAGWLWDPMAKSVLDAPAWLALVILGTVLVIVGRKKRPLIGYARN